MALRNDIQQKVIAELGIGDLAPESQQRIIARLGEVALQRATMNVLEALPEDKRDEFSKLSEGDDPAAVESFLREHVPNVDEIVGAAVKEEVDAFKNAQAEFAAK